MADCGIVGILAKDNGNVYEKLVHSLHVLQHRGEDACGILIHNNGESQLERRLGLVSTGFHFTPESIMHGDRGIGHTRYPTTNLTTDLPACDIQPVEIIYPWIKLYIAHNGTITSFYGLPLSQTESDQQSESEVVQEEEVCDSELTQDSARQLLKKVKSEMVGGTDTETVGRILAYIAQYCTLEEALKKVIPKLAGSFAFLIQTEDKVIGIRDPHGIRPLCFGELPDGYVIASESCVMNELRKLYYQGAKIPRQDVPPGGGVIMSDEGVAHVKFADSPRTAFCIFEDAYFSRPDSNVRGQILSSFRQRCGEQLGKRLKGEFTLQEASESIIIPIPDGGIP